MITILEYKSLSKQFNVNVEVSNRFLADNFGDEESESDEDDIGSEVLNISLNQHSSSVTNCNAPDDNEDDEEGYELVTSKHKKPKTKQKYSSPCEYNFCCSKGSKNCCSVHSEQEKEFFDKNRGKGNPQYKSVFCQKNRDGVCKFAKRTHMCAEAHNEGEIRCYKCDPKTGIIGHSEHNCNTVRTINEESNRNSSLPLCKKSFTCTFPWSCGGRHSDDEMKFFKHNNDKGVKGYKSKPCVDHLSKDRKAVCKHESDSLLCPYYHTQAEARCYKCRRIGHSANCENCPEYRL